MRTFAEYIAFGVALLTLVLTVMNWARIHRGPRLAARLTRPIGGNVPSTSPALPTQSGRSGEDEEVPPAYPG